MVTLRNREVSILEFDLRLWSRTRSIVSFKLRLRRYRWRFDRVKTGRESEKQDKELNRKEGEDIQGVTLSGPAELSKHILKAFII